MKRQAQTPSPPVVVVKSPQRRKRRTPGRGVGLALASLGAIGLSPARSVAAAPPAPEIAITVDDLPAHGPLPAGDTRLGIAKAFITALQAAGVPPTYGFVNAGLEEAEPGSRAVLPAWRAAGLPLGNHTFSHMDLKAHALTDWEADVVKDEPRLQALMDGADWRWLRFPYLSEGATPQVRAQARNFLAGRGYRIAAVTMSFGDYAFNPPYARCLSRGDGVAVARLEQAYLDAARAEAARSRAMSKALYGRDIPYVLLMHIGGLDARMLPRLLALYRAEGFRFVSLAEAERDPFYASSLDPALPAAPDSLEAALKARGLPVPAGTDLHGLDGVCT